MARNKKQNQTKKLDALLVVFQQLAADMRYRSEAEYVYIAAAIAGFAALSAGILASGNNKIESLGCWQPSLIAAISIVVLAGSVTYKVLMSHKNWKRARDSSIKVAKKINNHPNGRRAIPQWMRDKNVGRAVGHRHSLIVLWSAAIPAIGLCLMIYFS